MGLEMLLPMLAMGAMTAMSSRRQPAAPQLQPVPEPEDPVDPPLAPIAANSKQAPIDALNKYKNNVLSTPGSRNQPAMSTRKTLSGGGGEGPSPSL